MLKYITGMLLLPLLLWGVEKDSVQEFKSDEIIILDNKFSTLDKTENDVLNSTEEVLKSYNSVDLISRANFAYEPVVRGYNQDRLNITIDGMRAFSACIDKMDPITSYIEVENLQQTEVSAEKDNFSNGISTGGSINFVTSKPNFKKSFYATIDNQFNSVSNFFNTKGIANYTEGKLGFLASFSIKRSGDYTAGNYQNIRNSSFNKENVRLNFSYNQSNEVNHNLEYIADRSFDIGYPALIMDTRETFMNMASYNLNIDNLFDIADEYSLKLYYNDIYHLMDDFNRSEEEINNRKVMPGMYMPMVGNTKTFGALNKANFYSKNSVWSLALEYYNTNSFSDMDMQVLNSDEEMYLINLGDINTGNIGFTVSNKYMLDERFIFNTSVRVDYLNRNVDNELAKAMTEAFWNNNYNANYLILNGSVGFSFKADENNELIFTLSSVERAPSHIENYGYYIYNISDNSIYIGSPELETEKSYSVNVSHNFKVDDFELNTNLFGDYITGYIAGIIDESIPANEDFGQSFRRFRNLGNAGVAGIETEFRSRIFSEFYFTTKLKYQYSYSFRFNETLPFTPPLSGVSTLSYNGKDIDLVFSSEYASSQNNISKQILIEDRTPGYFLLNIRSNYNLSDLFDLKLGIENLLNNYYYTHFSINNLPAPGRNFYIGVVANIQ